jgi:inhibitor of KinA sporulation pathway (predicted exonuclease)
MDYVVFDLEFNQDFSSLQNDDKMTYYPFEIIQIGAIKLDSDFKQISTFNRYIKPTLYNNISPFITELTGITTQQLISEQPFSKVYLAFVEFITSHPCVFCTWGMSDMKELFRNVAYHQLNKKLLPKMFINLQPYTSLYLKLPAKKLLRLEHAVQALNIPLTQPFHNALHDAYYTTELFKKIYTPSIQPKLYDSHFIPARPRQPKKEIDTDKLIQQFEKMYARKTTEVEQEMILLAYKMGKTNQFLK